jgi:CBS domain-containing protein
MKLGEVCRRRFATVSEDEPVTSAAARMLERRTTEAVVVARHRGHLVPRAILSAGDVMLAMARGEDVPLERIAVADVMPRYTVAACETEELDVVLERMRRLHVARMPVVDVRGALVGVLTADDVLGLTSDRPSGGAVQGASSSASAPRDAPHRPQ